MYIFIFKREKMVDAVIFFASPNISFFVSRNKLFLLIIKKKQKQANEKKMPAFRYHAVKLTEL